MIVEPFPCLRLPGHHPEIAGDGLRKACVPLTLVEKPSPGLGKQTPGREAVPGLGEAMPRLSGATS